MFTIKFYSGDGYRQVIKEADSFTVLRCDEGAEITLHHKNPADDCRIDIADEWPNGPKRCEGWPPVFGKAIIENAAGRTTEIITIGAPLGLSPRSPVS